MCQQSEYAPISHSFKLINMSLLPETLMTIQSRQSTFNQKMNKLVSHYNGIFFRHSKVATAESVPKWPKFELIQYFMHVLFTWNFEKDQNK